MARILKSILFWLLVLVITFITGMFVSLPLNVWVKVGCVLLGAFSMLLLLVPLAGMMVFLLLRPVIALYSNFKILPYVPVSGLFAILITIALFFYALTNKSFTFKVPNIKPLMYLFAFSWISFIFSADRFFYITQFLRMLSWFSLYIFVFNLIKRERDVKNTLWCLMLSCLYLASLGLYQYFVLGMKRVNSLGGQADNTGIYFSFALFAAIALLLQFPRDKRKPFAVLMTLLVALMLFLTFHLGSWIALTAGLPVLIKYYRRLLKYVIVLGLLAGLVFYRPILNRIQEVSEKPRQGTTSLGARFVFWEISFENWKKSPIIGSGWGSSMSLLAEKFHMPKNTVPPHNDYISIAVDTGIVGLIFYVAFLWGEFKYFIARLKKKSAYLINIPMLAMIIYFTVSALALHMFNDIAGMGLFVTLLAVTKKFNIIADNEPNLDHAQINNVVCSD